MDKLPKFDIGNLTIWTKLIIDDLNWTKKDKIERIAYSTLPNKHACAIDMFRGDFLDPRNFFKSDPP